MWQRPAAAAAAALAGTAAAVHHQRQRQPASASGRAQQQRPEQTRDGKTVPLPRNVSMTCGANCGGLSELKIIDMEEGRANVDFRAAKGCKATQQSACCL